MKKIYLILLVFVTSVFFYSCDDDDDVMDDVLLGTGNIVTYDLKTKDVDGISGTATFTEVSDGSVNINLLLSGTPDDGSHPAHIHFNSASEGGEIALTLNSVDGKSGYSTTNVTELDDGTPVTYGDLLNFDGYINVHLSDSDLNTIVAQGDIGQNILNGKSITYDLGEKRC